jgi:hypothetical protein
MIMLLLVTLMVLSAFRMSTANLKSVRNVQARDEAISAARLEIEKVVASPFTQNPVAAANLAIGVDINNDSVPDYNVAMDTPVCERVIKATSQVTSSVQLPGFTPGDAFNTVWRLRATATDTISGVSVTVVHRIRILLDQIDKDAVCT